MSRWASSWFGSVFSVFFFCTVVGSWGDFDRVQAADSSPLISQSRAVRYGIERQWHTQVTIDPWNNRVTHLTYVPKSETCPDTLFVQTERSVVFAIDAETGKTLWSKLVGRPGLISEAVDANNQVVGVLNGSTLFILDRLNGRTLWSKSFRGVPASGPVLSKRYAYVPYIGGCVAAYPLWKTETSFASSLIRSQAKVEPLLCPSLDRIATKPVLIESDRGTDRLAWVNRSGACVGSVSSASDSFHLDYSLRTPLGFEASPALVPSRFVEPDGAKVSESGKLAKEVPIFGALLVAAADGEISAVRADTGVMLWEYHFGEPIVQPIVIIESRAYVLSQYDSMICFDARSGEKLWTKKGVSQFVAQAGERIYVLDSSRERLLILRATDGSPLGQIAIPGFKRVLCNDQTDRIFLATESGLIQSLRQRGVKETIRYR